MSWSFEPVWDTYKHMSADYIGECPNCAEHALHVDDCICWRTGPNEDDAYASSLGACAAGQSELRYLVASYKAKCHECDYQQEIVKVLRNGIQ